MSKKANPELVRAFAPLRAELRNPSAPFDPWWWPVESGHETADWGLDSEDSHLLIRLRGGGPTKSRYPEFCGSIAAVQGAVVVVSTRPSEGCFPSASCTKLYNRLKDADIGDAHITDMLKFRGPTDERATSWEMWSLSIDCLLAEFNIIRPSAVLIIPGARCWVSAWLGRGFGRWGALLSAEHRRLLQWISDNAVEVPFWGGNSRKGQDVIGTAWTKGLTEARKCQESWQGRTDGDG